MTIMAYYFTYYAGNFELYSVTGIVGIATGIIGSGFVCPWFYRQFRHKGYALAIGFGLSGLFYIPIFWFIPQQIVFWVFYAFFNLFQTAVSGLRYSCDGDNAYFTEYQIRYSCGWFSFGLYFSDAQGRRRSRPGNSDCMAGCTGLCAEYRAECIGFDRIEFEYVNHTSYIMCHLCDWLSACL